MNTRFSIIAAVLVFCSLVLQTQAVGSAKSLRLNSLVEDFSQIDQLEDLEWERSAPDGESIPNDLCTISPAIVDGINVYNTSISITRIVIDEMRGYFDWFAYSVPVGSEETMALSSDSQIGILTSCSSTSLAQYGNRSLVFDLNLYKGLTIYIAVATKTKTVANITMTRFLRQEITVDVITITVSSALSESEKEAFAKDICTKIGNFNLWPRVKFIESSKRSVDVSFYIIPETPGETYGSVISALIVQYLNNQTLPSSIGGIVVASYTVQNETIINVSPSAPIYVPANPRCNSTADCSDHGTCVSGGCSCWPGFGGINCADAPQAACASAFQPVNSTAVQFVPTYTINVAAGNFLMNIAAPLDNPKIIDPATGGTTLRDPSTEAYALDTVIIWQGRFNGSQCNYPSTESTSTPFWTKNRASSPDCKDTYALSLAWRDARSACGFQYDSVQKVWTQQVTVVRTYSLPFDHDLRRSGSTLGVVSSTFNVHVSFPDEITTSTNISVTGPKAAHVSAVVGVTYLQDRDLWQVITQIYTGRPYHLGNLTAGSTFGSRYRSDLTTLQTVGTCTSNDNGCNQYVTSYVSGCAALSGRVDYSLSALCNFPGSMCPPISELVNISALLSTQGSCNLTHQLSVQNQTLQSFKTASLATPQTEFRASTVAFFGANVGSSDHEIVNKTLTSVCYIFGSDPTCYPVIYNTLAPTNGYNPVFSINLAQTRALTNSSTAETFVIKAVVKIAWADNNRRREVAHYYSSDTNPFASIRVQPEAAEIASNDVSTDASSEKSGDNIWKLLTIALGSVLVGGCVIASVVAFIVFRRRENAHTHA